MKTIAVLTSGGDAPGMNAAIRAVVRAGIKQGLRVLGVEHGYQGLLGEEFREMDARSVSETIQHGGTILYTARCPEFMVSEGVRKAKEILEKHEVDALIVIGGDGSYRGAKALSDLGFQTIGVPATIDLDIASTDYTIGFDTAVDTAAEAIDKIRDTSSSHERCSIIEVMGRSAGYIAVVTGLGTGADDILIPETYPGNIDDVIEHVRNTRKVRRRHHIIVVAEGIGNSMEMAKKIEQETGMETRATILGYLQRGGSPSGRDRFMGTLMGARAVRVALTTDESRVVCLREGRLTDMGITEAVEMKKDFPVSWAEVGRLMDR